jgi:hypothetical protein
MRSRLEERCVITLSTASPFTLLHIIVLLITLRLLGFTLPAFHLIVAIACGIAGAPSDAPSPSSEHLFLIRLLVLGWPLTIGIGYWVLETLFTVQYFSSHSEWLRIQTTAVYYYVA